MIPVIRDIKPIRFLYFSTRTTMAELSGLVRHVQESLYADAVQHGLFISGPAYWNYFNFQDLEKPFDLEISVPVAGLPENYKGKYATKTSPSFRCVSGILEGSWDKFPDAYGELMAYAREQNLRVTGESREAYLNIDFERPDANRTEIQIGINE
jgi:effector-binding domain-containing protein